MTGTINRGAVAAIALLTATALASCSGDEPRDDGVLQVTSLGLCNEIPVYWADEKGIFDAHDVEVELVTATGGAAALSALQSGDVDLAFTNPFSTMIASSQGLDLRWIATAYETTHILEEGTNSIAVAASSGITDAAGLSGATIGVNEVGGINNIITVEWLKMRGGDPESVEFVALPFNDLAPAVASGKIDAAQVPAQYVDPELGLVSLDDPYVAVGDGKRLIFAGYVATGDGSEAMKESLQAFQQSLIEADEALALPENQDEKFAIEAAHCKQDAEYLATLNENPFDARVDLDALKRMGAILQSQGLVDEAPDPGALVSDYTVTK